MDGYPHIQSEDRLLGRRSGSTGDTCSAGFSGVAAVLHSSAFGDELLHRNAKEYTRTPKNKEPRGGERVLLELVTQLERRCSASDTHSSRLYIQSDNTAN